MGSDKPSLCAERELKRPTWWQGLFGRQPRENAVIRIHNLLARMPVREITELEVADIFREHRVNLRRHLKPERLALYRSYLDHCMKDHHLSDSDLDDLQHLRDLLALPADEAERAHDAVAGELLRGAYDEMMEEGNVDEARVAFLEKLQGDLRIPDRLAETIINEKRSVHIRREVDRITDDLRISPQEWEDLQKLARVLRVSLEVEEASREQFDRMKRLWLLENGDMPTVEPDIILQRGEICHYMGDADWLESRTVTKRINYGGLGYRVRIMKGLYWRGGSMGLQRVTAEEIAAIDIGRLYVTSKRILFNGGYKNMNLPLGRIIEIVPYTDGVGVEKDRGLSPIFRVGEDAEVLALVLGRVLDEIT